jgi:hypothetical protein
MVAVLEELTESGSGAFSEASETMVFSSLLLFSSVHSRKKYNKFELFSKNMSSLEERVDDNSFIR